MSSDEGECPSGLLLPILNESEWNVGVRATLYLLGLLYCFLGVAIIADIFMGAIETITSKTRKVYLAAAKENEPEVVEVRIWNDTVANLTLMALGSSAPEILLSVIEIIGKNFEAGELGPGTIVGSAAFNLLIICAVCIISIPDGEIKPIKMIRVFAVTSFFSLLAYFWLLVILKFITPNVVDLWEAIITFLFFPILVLVAFMVDRDMCGFPKVFQPSKQLELGNFQPGESERMLKDKMYFKDGKLDKDALIAFVKEVKKYPGLSDEDAALLAASKLVESQPHSRMWYRIGAVRSLSGGRKTHPQLSMKLKEVYETINENPDTSDITPFVKPVTSDNAVIEFHAVSCAVLENIGKFPVTIVRHGNLEPTVSVRVESIDGTAQEHEDYIPVNEVITFNPMETEKQITVEIVNDNQWEPDEEFFLKITIIDEDEKTQLGRIRIMEITILNDDEPGVISFQKRGMLVKESIGLAQIPVVRKNGADGQVSVKWKTIDRSAINGKDFVGGSGEIIFKHTETLRMLEIPIIDDMDPEKDECFEVELYDATGGARIGNINRVAITITNDDDFNSVMGHLMMLTNANMDALKVHQDTWGKQIRDAMNVNGGDLETATGVDYFMHFLTFGWKIFFSLVPPAGMLGGWLCFVVSLGMIGLLTAVIGDLASIFGCLVGLEDSITAITLVAMGTSLPDTFASKTAAMQEKYADNAIGNVTGSNSVNVFLGLGLPWLMAAIYHAANKTEFVVDSGSLGFSVLVYSIVAIMAIGLLMMRRYLKVFGNAELGGPKIPKILSGAFLVFLWFVYIMFSCLQTYKVINVNF